MRKILLASGLIGGFLIGADIWTNGRSADKGIHDAAIGDISVSDLAAPADFGDDICWVAPEWRDN